MSPIVLIVFGPVVLIGVAFVALLLGAASTGVWEAVDRRDPGPRPSTAGVFRPRQERPSATHSRAA
jgi:hypothetical protein